MRIVMSHNAKILCPNCICQCLMLHHFYANYPYVCVLFYTNGYQSNENSFHNHIIYD